MDKIMRLDKVIRKNGFTYHLIDRSDRFAIYEQSDKGKVFGYEVFKIKIQRERVFDGRFFPRKEKFPANEDFGKTAWSISDIERAFSKYHQLISENDATSCLDPVGPFSIAMANSDSELP